MWGGGVVYTVQGPACAHRVRDRVFQVLSVLDLCASVSDTHGPFSKPLRGTGLYNVTKIFGSKGFTGYSNCALILLQYHDRVKSKDGESKDGVNRTYCTNVQDYTLSKQH